MKFTNKIQFGFNAVQAGQKSATVNAEPRLIANSTSGKFVITAPVSKALNIAVGEKVMFFNNIAEVEAGIQARVEAIVNWATEQGINLDSREGYDAAVNEFTVWAIAKGVLKYDSKGNPVMASERYTEEDKKKYIEIHGAEILAENRELLISRNGGVDADDETLISLITIDDIESPKYHDATGAKTATTSTATGVGVQLNFTDTAIWTALKADLGDNKEKKNRVYNVCLDSPITLKTHNGKELVDVTAYPIEFVADEDPIVRVAKA